jgi:hypothetical protein
MREVRAAHEKTAKADKQHSKQLEQARQHAVQLDKDVDASGADVARLQEGKREVRAASTMLPCRKDEL